MSEPPESAMFRPPVNRAMRVLDRSFFQKSIPISAARIRDNKQISKYRTELGHDTLRLDRMQTVRSVRDSEGQETKALLLRPEVKQDGNITFFSFFLFSLKRNGGDRVGGVWREERERERAKMLSVRCLYMESKALRADQDFPSQPLTVLSQTKLRLLELPYVCAT